MFFNPFEYFNIVEVLKLIPFFLFSSSLSVLNQLIVGQFLGENEWGKGNNLFRCVVFLSEILDEYANIFEAIVRFQGFIRFVFYRVVVFLFVKCSSL